MLEPPRSRQGLTSESSEETVANSACSLGWRGATDSVAGADEFRVSDWLYANPKTRRLKLTNPLPLGGQVAKRSVDLAASIAGLVLLAPLMILVAAVIKATSPSSPIFFSQKRHGEFGQRIRILKFRTMVPHSEPPGVVTQATAGDERVTKIGALLRRTSLDELPQLLNVLRGEMSLIGPRPHAVEHDYYYADLVPRYAERLCVKPGITGWAQIRGFRGPTTELRQMIDRVEHDLWYVENWSMWLDLRIGIHTLFVAFRGPNAL